MKNNSDDTAQFKTDKKINKKLALLCIVFNIALIATPIGFLLNKTGIFSKEPVITTKITAGEDAPVLRIVADEGFKPRVYKNAEGEPAGADVEAVFEAANRLGMKPEIVFSDWITARNSINDGNADIILGLEIFSDMKGVTKTIPISTDNINVYGKTKITDAASLADKKVGLMAQSVIMSMFDLNCKYVEYYTNEEILQALQYGEVDYAICHRSIANSIIKENGYELTECFALMKSYPSIGVREDETELHASLNEVLREMADDGTIQKLESKWVNSSINNTSVADVVKNNLTFCVSYLIIFLFAEFVMTLLILQSRYYTKSISFNERIKEQYSLLKSMAEIYVSIHLIDLNDNTFTEFSSKNFIRKYSDENLGAAERMKNIIKNTIVPEMHEAALKFTDLTTVSDRIGNNKMLSGEFLSADIGWIRAQFVVVGYDDNGKATELVFTTLAIDHEKKKEEYLIHISNSDELTGIPNRHAYETDMDKLREAMRDDCVVVSLDLNGLKYVNDTSGHSAGDALLQSIGRCTNEVFGKYGKAYRVGGDEFMAFLYIPQEKIPDVMEEFRKSVKEKNKNIEHEISFSCGYTSYAENRKLTVDELVLIADKKMYQEKADHYKISKYDRRTR